MTTTKTEENTITAKEINAMTKAALVELIETSDLDVEHKSIKSLPALKEAVLAALGFEAEDDSGTVEGYTYIGGGENSPSVINFMGLQKFVRGELTEVTDPAVLAKLSGVTTFVKGKATQAQLHNIDTDAKVVSDAQRASDIVTNQYVAKKFRGE